MAVQTEPKSASSVSLERQARLVSPLRLLTRWARSSVLPPTAKQICSTIAPHTNPLDQIRTGPVVEASYEVGDSAERLAVASADFLANRLA